jgi:hypothetical protein
VWAFSRSCVALVNCKVFRFASSSKLSKVVNVLMFYNIQPKLCCSFNEMDKHDTQTGWRAHQIIHQRSTGSEKARVFFFGLFCLSLPLLLVGLPLIGAKKEETTLCWKIIDFLPSFSALFVCNHERGQAIPNEKTKKSPTSACCGKETDQTSNSNFRG